MGLSRSTTGCVSACLFREFQIGGTYEGLIETVPGVNLEILRMDKYEIDPAKDTLFRGEFEVVKELIAALPDGAVSTWYKNGLDPLLKYLDKYAHAISGFEERMRQGHW